MLDTVISNGIIVNHDGRVAADVGIQNGRISVVAAAGSMPEAAQVIDATNRFVMPGAIDPHVHFGLYTDFATDFETETRSAALGGVTFIKHMLISDEPYDAALEHGRRVGEARSHVDFAFDIEMRQERHLNDIGHYHDLGVSSYKFFLTYQGELARGKGIVPCDDGYLLAGLRGIAAAGKPATARIHCEAIDIIARLRPSIEASGADSLEAWMATRPGFVEASDMNRAAWLARLAGCPVCVVHVSSAEGVEVLALAKSRGDDIHGETCLHFLHFTIASELGSLLTMTPAIKTEKDRDRLWRGIADGTIDSVGSDHVWMPLEEKAVGSVWTTVAGFGGVGLLYPYVLSEGVTRGRISLERAVAVTSYNAARWYGFYPAKGAIEVGADADINIVDMGLVRRVTPDVLRAAADWTPYQGMDITGWPVLTLLRGEVIARDGELEGRPGIGRFVRPVSPS